MVTSATGGINKGPGHETPWTNCGDCLMLSMQGTVVTLWHRGAFECLQTKPLRAPVLGPAFPLIRLKRGCCYGWLPRKRVLRGCIIQQLQGPCQTRCHACVISTQVTSKGLAPWTFPQEEFSAYSNSHGVNTSRHWIPGSKCCSKGPQALSSRRPMLLPA